MGINNLSEGDIAQSKAAVLALIGLLLLGAIAVSALAFSSALDDDSPSKTPAPTVPRESSIPETGSQPIQYTDSHRTGNPTETPATIPAQTPLPTATYIETATRTPTPAPGPYANVRYSEFVDVVFGETKSKASVPVRIRGWRVVEGEILLVAVNLSAHSNDEGQRVKQVNTLATAGYTQAVVQYDNGNIDGKIPNRLRIVEVNNINSKPKMWYLNTSLAREYYLNKITAPEFTNQYWETVENQTSTQKTYVSRLDQTAGNVTLYNETAYKGDSGL